MTKIDFYTGCEDKLRTACQLSHKAMQNGVKVLLATPDATTCDALDKLLWHFPPTAFIPHCRSDASEAEYTPVLLAHDAEKFPHHELLISLHAETPGYFSRFQRVIEIVSTDEADRQRGRARYKFYQDRGYELRHVDLSQKAVS